MSKGRDAKPHIGIYGRRNNGKSSLINCLAGQDIAIVSSRPGLRLTLSKNHSRLPALVQCIAHCNSDRNSAGVTCL